MRRNGSNLAFDREVTLAPSRMGRPPRFAGSPHRGAVASMRARVRPTVVGGHDAPSTANRRLLPRTRHRGAHRSGRRDPLCAALVEPPGTRQDYSAGSPPRPTWSPEHGRRCCPCRVPTGDAWGLTSGRRLTIGPSVGQPAPYTRLIPTSSRQLPCNGNQSSTGRRRPPRKRNREAERVIPKLARFAS